MSRKVDSKQAAECDTEEKSGEQAFGKGWLAREKLKAIFTGNDESVRDGGDVGFVALSYRGRR